MKKVFTTLALLSTLWVSGQNQQSDRFLVWTGEIDSDFFNEQNWREASMENLAQFQQFNAPTLKKKSSRSELTAQMVKNNKTPVDGTIDPGKAIAYSLYIKDANLTIDEEFTFDTDNKKIVVNASKVTLNNSINQGQIILDLSSTLNLASSKYFSKGTTIQIKDADSWLIFDSETPAEVKGVIDQLIVSNLLSTPRLRSYYDRGTVVDMSSLLDTPLTVYSENSLKGSNTGINVKTIYKGNNIPNGFNNKIRSFLLKRGNMASFAIKDNGAGKSKVYIASEEDLVINELPLALQGTISFIRVTPWNWVTKKGTGNLITGLDAGWFYDWGFRRGSQPNYEYVPMTWGHTSTSFATINQISNKDTITHILGFNESDACDGQSGQYGNLCQPAVAVDYAQYLMHTGLRIGSPAPRENGPSSWLKEFNAIAKERDVRFDFVAVHWYDWGGHFSSNPQAPAETVFNRFKAYLANVYAIYGLPIWITEFNANPNRDNALHAEFLKLALPYLEQLPYVERYAYFQPSPQGGATVGPGNYYLDNNLTNIGTIYKNQVSTPSITAPTMECLSNLEGMDQEVLEIPGDDFEAENAKFIGTPTLVVCGRSSNGTHVAVGAPVTNAIAFDSVMMNTAGSYRMTISYMTAGARKVKLTVNGTEIGVLNMPKSGEWCFNNGSPSDFKVSINLKSGRNNIEFRAIGTDAPSIDKINLVRESFSFEAEKAELVGDATIETCGKASNGGAVDLKTSPINAARFKVTATTAGLYFLDIAYVTKTQLVGGVIVNDKLVKNEFFDFSGDLCSEGGVPRVTTIEIALKQGSNSIEVRPLGVEAPLIDKIAIISKDLMLTSLKEELLQSDASSLLLYPNPSSAADNITLVLKSTEINNFDLKVYDVLGNMVAHQKELSANQPIIIQNNLPSGVFVVVVNDGVRSLSKKLIVR